MKIGSRQFDLTRHVYVMGILNVTHDSFSDGGLYLDPEKALDRALRMQEEGADLIDLGGESTHPGAEEVDEEEEWRRVSSVLKKIVPRLSLPVSIDTRKAAVAEKALGEGAALVNDVSALRDPTMAGVVSKAGVPVILMHMKGEPKTMQMDVTYDDVVSEVLSTLRQRTEFAVSRDINRERILIDPGIGFGKRLEDNLALLSCLSEFRRLEFPIVFGSSRKSFVRGIFGTDESDVLLGSVVTAVLAAERGASIVRVHDVKETHAAIRLVNPPIFE